MQRASAIRINDRRRWGWFGVHLFNVSGEIKEALCAQEKAIPWPSASFDQREVLMKVRVRSASLKAEVLGAAFRIKAPCDCDRFKERGLAAAVLADDECHCRM